MIRRSSHVRGLALACVLGLGMVSMPQDANAQVEGLTGSSFDLVARPGYVSMPDGASIYSWGYSDAADSTMQLPGPTLKLVQGVPVTITLTNELPPAAGHTSLIIPGMEVTATPGTGVEGPLAQEAVTGASVTYTFTPTRPGTYQYHSATQPELQVEMGLYGAIVVYPDAAGVATAACGGASAAYGHPGTCYDKEYLFLLSQIDLDVHQAAEMQSTGAGPVALPEGPFADEYWMINGRAAPDTLTASAAQGNTLLPTQPYNSSPECEPYQRVLNRVVGAGTDTHPFHMHGNHAQVIARDGHMLVSAADPTKLAGPSMFTIPSRPGETVDAIWSWTGEELGWDFYGHSPSDPMEPGETHHGVPIPVQLPDLTTIALGGWYSGSPFLGAAGALPPGEGGLNPKSGFAYMWHSHNEKELINNDIFPGGMMTMMIVVPPTTP